MNIKSLGFRLLAVVSLALALCTPLSPPPAEADVVVYRVAVTGATSGACGDVWANPCDLQYALTSLANAETELWLAAGTYVPGSLESDSFVIPEGVEVYGGFDGIDDEWADRDFVTNVTTWSGDLGGGNQSTHVIQMLGPVTAQTVLDGFTISGGNANDLTPGDRGGGLYCHGAGSGNTCSPTLQNLTFIYNYANHYGGAVYLDGSDGGAASPTLIDVDFLNNAADLGSGGAMYNNGSNGTSSPNLQGGLFGSNVARVGSGGAMYNNGSLGTASPQVQSVTFSTNWAATNGGAVYSEAINGGSSSPTLTDVTFTDNSAVMDGGALYNYADGGSAESSPTLTAVSFYENVGRDGGAMYSKGATTGQSNAILDEVYFALNVATRNGGGMYLEGLGGKTEPALREVYFHGNDADNGAALYMLSHGGSDGNADVDIVNAEFVNNEADSEGGAIHQRTSGEDDMGAGSTLSITNAIFSGNLAGSDGGAIRMYTELVGGGDPDPVWADPKGFLNLTNVSMSNNVALGSGGALALFANTGSIASVNVHNSILWGDNGVTADDEIDLAGASDAQISYSDIAGGCPLVSADCSAGGVLDTDPFYVDATSHNLRVRGDSPVIDAGDNNGIPSGLTTDLIGDLRFVDQPGVPDTGQGVPPIIDMGAFEAGTLNIAGNAGIAGAVLHCDEDGPQTVTTYGDGDYNFNVPASWSGTVTPELPHYFFNPASRSYAGLSGDLVGQDYTAVPYVVFAPGEGETVCRQPTILVKLVLSDLTRTGAGAFNASTVTFKLDGVSVLGQAMQRVPPTAPNAWVHVTYKPTSDLTLGEHTAEFTHPESTGTIGDTWTFTAADIACGTTTLSSDASDAVATEEPAHSTTRELTSAAASAAASEQNALHPESAAPTQNAVTPQSGGPSLSSSPGTARVAPSWAQAVQPLSARGVPHPGIYQVLMRGVR